MHADESDNSAPKTAPSFQPRAWENAQAQERINALQEAYSSRQVPAETHSK